MHYFYIKFNIRKICLISVISVQLILFNYLRTKNLFHLTEKFNNLLIPKGSKNIISISIQG